MKIVLIIVFISFALINNFYSSTIKVPQEITTIQIAIDSSSNGDTVLVSPGTYFENINFNGKNIVLGSLFLTTGDTSYISQTIIDGNQQGCVVVFESGEDSTTVLTGFTITNGYSYLDSLRGGGITCINSSNPTLINLIITNNEVIGEDELYGGGGIYCLQKSSPIIENVYIQNNIVSEGFGGGIYLKDSSNVKMTNLTVKNNRSGRANGGGIAIINSNCSISNSEILGNYSKQGGGIYIENSKLDIYSSIVNENLARNFSGGLGGGIYGLSSDLIIKNTDISNNSVEATFHPNSQGGGISTFLCSLFIENCTINQNVSRAGSGGGINTKGCNTKIFSTSITNNECFSDGGGINSIYSYSYEFADSLYLEDVVISNNSAGFSGGGLNYFHNDSTEVFKNVIIKNNIAGKNGGGLVTNQKIRISESSKCSIFQNKAKEGKTDIYIMSEDNNFLSTLYLDTVSVSNPNDYQVYPIQNINFNFKHALFQSVESDLYVSPTGSNSNSGIAKNEPLKTISFALSVASADSINQKTIYLAPGTYSHSLTDEEYPLFGRSYVSINGESAESTILDGESKNNLLVFANSIDVTLENFTIQNGRSYNGGGILINGQKILLRKLLIKDNYAEFSGGGISIHTSDQIKLTNLTVVNNISNKPNSSGGISYNNYNGGSKKIAIFNSIVLANTPNNFEFNYIPSPHPGSDSVIFGYSNIVGGEAGIVKQDSININWLEGNIDSDPLFVGGDPFDYNLSDSSPSINAGTPFFVWEGDTLINLSPSEYVGEAPDMGALESDVLISVEGKDELPTEFKLEQNYPNPFNPATTIKYTLPAVVKENFPSLQNVTLKIYDVLGSEVTTLVNEQQQPGYYEVQFDANGLTSGIYFYQLKTDEFLQTKKMLLIR